MLSIGSENVTEMDEEVEVMLSELDGEVDITVGRVKSISNDLIPIVTEFDALSVTVIVQLSYVPAASGLELDPKVIVLLSEAEAVELSDLHGDPYVISPA